MLIRRVTGNPMQDVIRDEIADPLEIGFSLRVHADDAFGAVPMSSAKGICDARGLARTYQGVAQGGERDGVRLVREPALASASRVQVDATAEIWQCPAVGPGISAVRVYGSALPSR